MKKLTLIVLSIMVLTGQGFCASLNSVTEGYLPTNANWVFHADYEKFNSSTIGKLIQTELKAMGVEEQLQGFKELFSFHPLDDVRNVTICGQGTDPAKAAAMMQGKFDPAKLTALVSMNPDYEKTSFQNYTIHSWIDEKKEGSPRMYGCFHTEDTVLLSIGKNKLQSILDILDGRSFDTMYQGDLVEFESDHEGIFILAAAENVGEIAQGLDDPGLLMMIKRLALAVGEDDSNLYVDITIQAENADNALKVSQTLQGLIAFASLSMQEQLPELARIAAAISVTSAEDVVRVHFAWDSTKLVDFLKKIAELKKAEDNKQNSSNTETTGSEKK